MNAIRLKGKGIKPAATKKTLSDRVREHYRAKSIEFAEAPTDAEGETLIPYLPPDITRITSQAIGLLHQRVKQFLDYVVGVQTTRDIDRLESANASDLEKARQTLMLEGEGMTRIAKEATAFVNKQATDKRDYALEKKAQYVFLSARIKQLEGDLKLISREMTRREHEIERVRGTAR